MPTMAPAETPRPPPPEPDEGVGAPSAPLDELDNDDEEVAAVVVMAASPPVELDAAVGEKVEVELSAELEVDVASVVDVADDGNAAVLELDEAAGVEAEELELDVVAVAAADEADESEASELELNSDVAPLEADVGSAVVDVVADDCVCVEMPADEGSEADDNEEEAREEDN